MHLSNSPAHIKLMDENWTITDVSVAGDIPKGEDLSEFLKSMFLLYLDLGLGIISMHTVYLSPFCNSVLKTVLKFLSLWTDNLWRQKYTLGL